MIFEAAGFGQWERGNMLHDCQAMSYLVLFTHLVQPFSPNIEVSRIVVTLNQLRSTPRRQLLLDTQSFSYLVSCLIL
jgi:hypothetical protein